MGKLIFLNIIESASFWTFQIKRNLILLHLLSAKIIEERKSHYIVLSYRDRNIISSKVFPDSIRIFKMEVTQHLHDNTTP